MAIYLAMWAEEDGFKTSWAEWKRKMDGEIGEWLKEIEANDDKHNGAKKID